MTWAKPSDVVERRAAEGASNEQAYRPYPVSASGPGDRR